MVTPLDKALAALIVGLVVLLAGHFGFHFSADVEAALLTVVTTVVVYLVPNKTA